MNRVWRLFVAFAVIVMGGAVAGGPWVSGARADGVVLSGGVPAVATTQDVSAAASLQTATPIKHLVVIFQENVSFDHYFGTYPNALNPSGEPAFNAASQTPTANTLQTANLLAPHNPNSVQPFRLDRTQALTCDQNHEYTAEQEAVDNGKMDKFVESTDTGGGGNKAQFCPKGVVMGYYDGNTVTGLWNYAQNYAMSDNSFGSVFGPSTPGALVLAAGDTGIAVCGPTNSSMYNSPGVCSPASAPSTSVSSSTKVGTVVGDPDQYYDDYSSGRYGSKNTAALAGRNIGDMLNTGNATWGWFNGGFQDNKTKHAASAYDQYVGTNPATDPNGSLTDYSAHHEPFQYFASTSNPHHLTPSSTAMIGQTDRANHQYDLTDFWSAAYAGNLPAVSFLKAPRYQDGHAGYSDPLDEQKFLVDTINQLQSLPSWKSTAVIISYDDSDGWYDHVLGPIVNHSKTPIDVNCGSNTDGTPARCGYGPRLPFLVISPYARTNYIHHTLTDQTSTLRFIEDNWLGGQRVSGQSFDNKAGSINGMFDFGRSDAHRLYLNPETGQPLPFNQGFEVTFNSSQPGQGAIYFGPGPGCTALVEVATRDQGIGTTHHTVLVTGNDMPGTVGDIGITPGATYSYEAVTTTATGSEIDNNGGVCYTVTVPQS